MTSAELDNALVKYLALVDTQYETWKKLVADFQEGHRLLSQAKYSMGPKNVSADCYDNRMQAQRGLAITSQGRLTVRDFAGERKLEKTRVESTGGREPQPNENGNPEDQLLAMSMQGMDIQQDTGANASNVDPSSGLRRRGNGAQTMGHGKRGQGESEVSPLDQPPIGVGPTAISEPSSCLSQAKGIRNHRASESEAAQDSKDTNKVKPKKERNPDPLLWFGVFVPTSLRQAQQTFVKGVDQAVVLANIHLEMAQLEQTINQLRAAKAKAADISTSR